MKFCDIINDDVIPYDVIDNDVITCDVIEDVIIIHDTINYDVITYDIIDNVTDNDIIIDSYSLYNIIPAYPDQLWECSSRYYHRLVRLTALVSDTLTHEHNKKRYKTT